MPKVNDIQAYWKELATKNGIDEETLKPLMEALGKDSVRKAMTEGFKPLPDYSHDLDEVRDKATRDTDAKYADWHQKELAKYNEYVQATELLKKYEAKHGKLEEGDKTVRNNEGIPVGLSKEDVAKLLDERMNETLSRRDSAYMDLLEIRETHLGTFKKPLDVKAFEKEWKEHPEWGNSMKQAYREFTEPEMAKVRETEFTSKLQQKYDEGVRDGFSRRSLPTDSTSKTFSPMFDRKEEVAKMGEREQETHSRQAFFDGLRDQKPA